ncbi:beta-propeller fold lactonase family protein [Nocardia sp. NPDC046473]|uniref:beta-propeller fold lactonase family protein n=1 Tax=Nocardia sp. NPDC046473 TaxID=3155733 RepID=UPI0033E206DD
MRDGELGRRRLLGIMGGAAGVGVAVATGVLRPVLAGAANGTRAFLGSYTSSGAGGSGISVATVDPGTGRLTVESTVDVADPSFLAFSPDRRYLYAVNEGSGAGTATAIDVRAPADCIEHGCSARQCAHAPVRHPGWSLRADREL